MDRVAIFDTTLRDGEQSPGCSMTESTKLLIAHHLEDLEVDVIEAGFPVISDKEASAVSKIAEEIRGPTICVLSRLKDGDIESGALALEKSDRPRIHVFVGTSEVHMAKKLRKSPGRILEMISQKVSRAASLVNEVEFSPEDASRTGADFLLRSVETAIESGASVINLPDTVGYSVGSEYAGLIRKVKESVVDNYSGVMISVHCHNDLGVATANTLAGLEAGARQAEVCLMGIGERAGNAQLEAVVMALKTRADYYGLSTGVRTQEICRAVRVLSSAIDKPVPDNLPVAGANALAHSAGIHQHGVLSDPTTYEVISRKDIGWEGETAPLSKHSGRHALKDHLRKMGYELEEEEFSLLSAKFEDLADSKKIVYNSDLRLLVQEVLTEKKAQKGHLVTIEKINYSRADDVLSAEIFLSQNSNSFEGRGSGDGPVSSAWNAVVDAIGKAPGFQIPNLRLKDFNVGKAAGGIEAMGLVALTIESNGHISYGRGGDTDIVFAFVRAMVAAVNHLLEVPMKAL